MEKLHLLPQCTQHKANLHSHTVCSDGRLTPEQTKEVYMRHGCDDKRTGHRAAPKP